jgi:hypothetical protein
MSIHHIAQLKRKIVRVKPDAVVTYDSDPFFQNETTDMHRIGSELLEVVAGKEFEIMGISRFRNRLFYMVPIDPRKTVISEHGEPMLFDKTFFPADYMEILDSGFMEAT